MPLNKLTLALTVAIAQLLTMPTSIAQSSTEAESHSNTDVDPNAPIVALDKLDSLKTDKQLNVTLPTIQHFVTKSGTPVALVQTHNLPMVDISVYFNAGSARDEAIRTGGFGIAGLTASMLGQGTTQHSQDELAEAIEQLGVSIEQTAYKDMFIVSLRSLSDPDYLNPALALMVETMAHPTFPKDNLARTKAQYLVGLQRQQEDPDTIASETFAKALYGNHPYAHPTAGTLESIPSITQADLKAFSQRFLVAKNANIAITGDVTLAQAKRIAEQLTVQLPKGSPAPALPDVKPLTQARTIHVPFDSTQTSVIIGQVGEKRATDLATLQRHTNFAIADDVVGGSNFQARLMADIRKKRGLTYGIYSGMTPMQSNGAYTISFSTRNDKANEAINATLDVIKETVKNGITQRELDLTKDSQINSFPLSFASNAAINSTIGMMGFYHLPDSFLQNTVKRIEQANLASVNQSYRTLIQPDRFLTVTVGNAQPATANAPTASDNSQAVQTP